MSNNKRNVPLCESNLLFFFALLLLVGVSKYNTITLPFYWDEMGAYVGPSLFLSRTSLINALPGFHAAETFFGHPFLAYLSLGFLFKVFGESPIVAHVFALLISVVGLFYTYLLGCHLHGRTTGVVSVGLMFFTPIHFAQSGMVTGDMLILPLGVMAVYYALTGGYAKYTVSAVAMLLVKETSAALVVSIVAFSLLNGNYRCALIFAAPLLAIAAFFLAQWCFTGEILPNPYFKNNKLYELSLADASARTFNIFKSLFWDGYGFLQYGIVPLCLFLRKKRVYKKEYLLFAMIFFSFVIPFTFVFYLERYLLPVLPYLCVTAAAAIAALIESRVALGCVVAVIVLAKTTTYYGDRRMCGSHENNMEYSDVVAVYKEACVYIEEHLPEAKVVTTWPLNRALGDPGFAYVKKSVDAGIFSQDKPVTGYDVILYSEQSDCAGARALSEYIGEVRPRLVKEFHKNGKSVKLFAINKL